jgi:hypothetical protein|tara:strand:+ start:347 stop:856 length:510 start_codon:yes stop_codon:yes gene_type:complete
MERLMFFGIDGCTAFMHSVDVTCALPFLRGRDFKIDEMTGVKDGVEVNLLREGEERLWVRHNHKAEIRGILDGDDMNSIHSLRIDFDNDDFINFSYGVFAVRCTDMDQLKAICIKLLEQYSYFAAENIWNFVLKQDDQMPIYIVQCVEEENIELELARMLEISKIKSEY